MQIILTCQFSLAGNEVENNESKTAAIVLAGQFIRSLISYTQLIGFKHCSNCLSIPKPYLLPRHLHDTYWLILFYKLTLSYGVHWLFSREFVSLIKITAMMIFSDKSEQMLCTNLFKNSGKFACITMGCRHLWRYLTHAWTLLPYLASGSHKNKIGWVKIGVKLPSKRQPIFFFIL